LISYPFYSQNYLFPFLQYLHNMAYIFTKKKNDNTKHFTPLKQIIPYFQLQIKNRIKEPNSKVREA